MHHAGCLCLSDRIAKSPQRTHIDVRRVGLDGFDIFEVVVERSEATLILFDVFHLAGPGAFASNFILHSALYPDNQKCNHRPENRLGQNDDDCHQPIGQIDECLNPCRNEHARKDMHQHTNQSDGITWPARTESAERK